MIRQALLLARNDLRMEARRFELAATAGFFVLVVVVMFALSFAVIDVADQPKVLPGMLWLTVAFAGALTLTRVFDRERENATLEALLAAPVHRLSIYGAKLLVTLCVLVPCAAAVVPALWGLYPGGAGFMERPGASVAVVTLGCLGYAAVGTLFAAGLARSGGKNVLLSVILYPITTPVLLYALVATQRILVDHPDTWATLVQLLALDVALLAVAALLFESVLVARTRSSASTRASAPVSSPRPTSR